ncbi:DNA-binding transcriptional regulator YhcF (GntR family) [Marmoricola sp. OAE513]|uniref:GntR family transcriptional regulator n=1 Tax=Marmoricola sp. OAE513 TaxID=2817894 RepID=UPI001D5B8024
MITIDADSALAPYEQVRAQYDEQIRSGALVAGTRLPTVRRLAEDLGLAANTVARAYRELEQSGLIETRGRAGSFVAGAGAEREAREAAAAYVARLHELGRVDDAVSLVEGLVRPAG